MSQQERNKRKRLRQQKKKALLRSEAIIMLSKFKIDFEIKNNGAHLIVIGRDTIIDFWPGTEKFIPRDTQRLGVGIKKVLSLC